MSSVQETDTGRHLVNGRTLRQILDAHAAWLEQRPDGRRADLSGATLAGLDLKGVNLRQANLRAAVLATADLSGADLSGAMLEDADLRGANLDAGGSFGSRAGRSAFRWRGSARSQPVRVRTRQGLVPERPAGQGALPGSQDHRLEFQGGRSAGREFSSIPHLGIRL